VHHASSARLAHNIRVTKTALKTIKNQQGQMTIFLAVTLIIIITCLAFVVNVGLFVKAKINLQNAVDAAAFAGASVQARQLSHAAHLNWEMRNTYKEWMFKYYVLGQKANTKTNIGSTKWNNLKENMDFTASPFWPLGHPKRRPNEPIDKYNVPSICIHFGTEHNLCEIASIPGLPRFKPVGLPSISDQHESFINAIVSTKAQDCSRRTTVNFGTAMLWAFGTKDVVFPGQTEIAANRVGAFPEAVEQAIRMRNLEAIINRPPVDSICVDGVDGCNNTISDLDGEFPDLPINERPIKAFMSAYRNLAGDNGSEMKKNFILRELAPKSFEADPSTLSGFLIPDVPVAGISARTKHYVDLQLMPLNLVTFFTFFSSNTNKHIIDGSTSVDSEAECTSSKVGVPIPAYPFGFVKNPKVLTYYAVHGETKFVGLFYPFTEREGIKIHAYSAAKPFGGRIGPRLFELRGDGAIGPRDRSQSYVSTLDFLLSAGISPRAKPGDPIPFDIDFWLDTSLASSTRVGGVPTAGGDIRFGIPNLLYDYEDFSDLEKANPVSSFSNIQTITEKKDGVEPKEGAGLHNKIQFELFAKNLPDSTGTIVDGSNIEQGINNARKPTRYEALNYLIPTFTESKDLIDTVGFVTKRQNVLVNSVFAPLINQSLLYKNITSITQTINEYLLDNDAAIQAFIDSLRKVAEDMRAKNLTVGDSGGVGSYEDASRLIFDDKTHPDMPNCAKASIAAMFDHFFRGRGTVCGIVPLTEKLREYYENQTDLDPNFYEQQYTESSEVPPGELMTAFMPGPRSGADQNGRNVHPFEGLIPNEEQYSRRNFYSTKFVAISKLSDSEGEGDFPLPPYFAANTVLEVGPTLDQDIPNLDTKAPYANTLDLSDLKAIFGTLNH
jgi:hypothetical protein